MRSSSQNKSASLVKRIFSCPTAPFREHFVLAEIKKVLEESSIPYFTDDSGQIIAGANSRQELHAHPRVGFLAHTDHPGFHVVGQAARDVTAKWFGGAPFKTMKGKKVRIYHPEDIKMSWAGKITKFDIKDYSREGLEFTIRLDREAELPDRAFGAFDFPGMKMQGREVIVTRAADDLAGVVIALGALLDTPAEKRYQSFAVFTRAEEVGFIGCLKLLQEKYIQPSMWTVSLEASRALPLAEIKKGPVLRLGDRSTLFNSEFSILFWKSAQNLATKNKKFTYQRRLMDGGSCEATALSLYGIPTTGLAVPLLNYHNQGAKGPQPEKISLMDLDKGRQVCAQLIQDFAANPRPLANMKEDLLKNYKTLEGLLT